MNPYQKTLAKKISEQCWWRGVPGMLIVWGDFTWRLKDSVSPGLKNIVRLPNGRPPEILTVTEICPDITDARTLMYMEGIVRWTHLPLRENFRAGVISRKVEAYSFEGFDRSYMEYNWISPGPWYREKASAILAAAQWNP